MPMKPRSAWTPWWRLGGFVELITAWHAGLLDVSQEEIVEHTSRLAETLAERYLVHALSVDDVPGTLPS